MFPCATLLLQTPAVVHARNESARRLSGRGERGGGERDEQRKVV